MLSKRDSPEQPLSTDLLPGHVYGNSLLYALYPLLCRPDRRGHFQGLLAIVLNPEETYQR